MNSVFLEVNRKKEKKKNYFQKTIIYKLNKRSETDFFPTKTLNYFISYFTEKVLIFPKSSIDKSVTRKVKSYR